jgi:hypothetical protein
VELDAGSGSFVGFDSFDHLALVEVLNIANPTQMATTPALSPLTSRLFCHSKSIMASL